MNELEIQRCMAKWAKHATPAGAPILRNIAFSSKATNYTPEMREAAKRLHATIPVTQAAPVAPPASPTVAQIEPTVAKVEEATESPAGTSAPADPTVVAVETSDAAETSSVAQD